MPESQSTWRSWHYIALWVIALLSLVFNVALVAGFYAFRAQAQYEVSQVAAVLNEVELNELAFPVNINETLPISLTVTFSNTFPVMISRTLPISTEVLFEDEIQVPINTVIPINTTVNIPIGAALGSNLTVPVPIATNIPINLDVTVPISRLIEVNTTVPVVFDLEVPINTEIPIETDVPVVMEIPVTVPLDEIGLDEILTQAQAVVIALAEFLGADLNIPVDAIAP
jgi:hypothetical protein